MQDLLEIYGLKLAKIVRENGLQTMELDPDIPLRESESRDWRLIEYVVNMLVRRNNIIFVSDPVYLAEGYVNMLSLAFQEPSDYFQALFEDWVKAGERSQQEKDAYYETHFARFTRYEILQIDIERIIVDSSSKPELWDGLTDAIHRNRNQYTFALKNFAHLYNNLENKPNQHRFDEFWSSEFDEPVFLIPMDWKSYNEHIEGGRIRLDHRRHTAPIPLTPRPSHLPEYSTGSIAPDNKFKFT